MFFCNFNSPYVFTFFLPFIVHVFIQNRNLKNMPQNCYINNSIIDTSFLIDSPFFNKSYKLGQ